MADPDDDVDDFLGTAGLTAARPMRSASSPAAAPDVARPTSYATEGPRRRKPAGERWEDKHVRRTFHLQSEMVDEFSELAEAARKSMSGAVGEAMQQWIARQRRAKQTGGTQ